MARVDPRGNPEPHRRRLPARRVGRVAREAAAGGRLASVPRSAFGGGDVDAAVQAARGAQEAWAERTAVERGDLVREIALALRERREELSAVVVEETGKPEALALGRDRRGGRDGALRGRRGPPLLRADDDREHAAPHGDDRPAARRRRRPADLLQHAASERRLEGVPGDLLRQRRPCSSPPRRRRSRHSSSRRSATRWVCRRASSTSCRGSAPRLAPRSSSIRQVDLVSFTGSAATGRWIAEAAGRRLAKVCLELGGKNALVVCDDADLDNAVRWAAQSAFSNAGQRCAAASRESSSSTRSTTSSAVALWKPHRSSRTPAR